ncbi:MAG: ATP-binding protein [Myxococcota bacterium]
MARPIRHQDLRSEEVRHRRLIVVLRVLLVASLLAIPTPLPNAFNPELGSTAVAIIALLVFIASVYGIALLFAVNGRPQVAQTLTFIGWTVVPVGVLSLYDGKAPDGLQTVILTLATLSLGILQNGMLALGTWRQARAWMAFGLVAFGGTLLWLSWSQGLDPVFGFSILIICLFTGIAFAWPARVMLGDLEEALVATESANLAKSRFLANMSHELRTPLNAILGYVELIREDDLSTPLQDVDKDLQRVEDAGRHLLNVIDAILDLTKIEAEVVPLQLQPTDIVGLLDQIVLSLRPLAKRGGLVLELAAKPMERLTTDPHKVRQILINLIGNAIKYTRQGSVTVSAHTNPHAVTIEVRDTGVGIAPENLVHVFEPFERTDATITKQVGGTGLGLAVSQKLAELLGGTLVVTSELQRGSCFALRLPRSEA